MSRPTFSMQPLEARRFLSASPAAHIDECPEVLEARQELQEVSQDFRHDRYAGRQAIAAIRAEVGEELRQMHEENGEELQEAVAPLRQELRAAIRALGAARAEILEDLQAIREKWQPTITADLQAIRAAHASGDADALKDATDQFHEDRSALYAELNVLKADLKAVTEEKGQAISDAYLAIEDKLAEFSPTLRELLDKLRAKQREVMATLQADHEEVAAAQEKLKMAVEECREEHAGEHATA
jgi:gas vesicle protein